MTEYLLTLFLIAAAIVLSLKPLRRDLRHFVQAASGGITVDWGSSK